MNRHDDDMLLKALVILIVCIVSMMMICVECALLPRYGWLWLILLLILALAAVFSGVMAVKAWRDKYGRRRK